MDFLWLVVDAEKRQYFATWDFICGLREEKGLGLGIWRPRIYFNGRIAVVLMEVSYGI